jgi:Holliday junction resolvase RusA-like endonuclease
VSENGALSFTVLGLPAPAGSKRGFLSKTGRVLITDDSTRSKGWKNQVADQAAQLMDGELWDGPLSLVVEFVLPRPKSHFGTGRNRGEVKLSAPYFPASRPDLDKLSRAVLDALTSVVYRDDAQVVRKLATKAYGHPARAEILVSRLDRPRLPLD